MMRRWVAVAAAFVIVVGAAGCSSGGGSSAAPLPKLDRKDWTPAGLATVKAAEAAISTALPGQCADAAISEFSAVPQSMQIVKSKVVPTGQLTCTVNDEVVEVTAFSSSKDRDAFVDDRSNGLCRIATAQAKKYKKPLNFPGLRWSVGAGNVTLQPDSESLARRLASITKGTFDGRPCATGITVEWNNQAVNSIDALGRKIAASGHGCDFVDLIPRESLDVSSKFTDKQLPAALGGCNFDGQRIELITYDHTTPTVDTFVAGRVKSSCVSDPATGVIRGDNFVVLAPGTEAQQVHAVVGGTLAPTSCT